MPGAIRTIRLGQGFISATLILASAARAAADGAALGWVIAVAMVFGTWYFGGLLLSRRTRDRTLAAWWLGGLTLIWVGAVMVAAEFVWLAFPLWMLAGFVLRMRWAVPFSLLVFAVVVVAPLLHRGTTTYANIIGPLVGGVFALGISRGYLELVHEGQERRRLIASLIAAQDEMTALQDELARTQRESGAGVERTRLSRDIHDTVAQSLTSISMIARGANPDDHESTVRAFEQIQTLAGEGLADTRRIVNALMPSELEGSTLGEALRRMLTKLNEETGIRTDLRVDDTVPALPLTAEIALLRTAQSGLANVRRHADASHVVMSLVDAGNSVRLDIVDDGSGFDATHWDAPAPRHSQGGYGLHAMHARLRELGGTLDVESTPGEGTALSASVPLGAVKLDTPGDEQ